MILLLDFDNTLFNLEQYRKDFGMEGTRFGDDPALYIERLTESTDLSRYVFRDVLDFLKDYAQHHLVLCTAPYPGQTLYQREKVEQSGILPLFDETIFTDFAEKRSKGDVAAKKFQGSQEKIVFLDDAPAQIKSMEECCPNIVSVKMNRKEISYVYNVDYSASNEVTNLKEFAQLLKSF
ncbi:hypothetical protein CL630_02515 [bacterium]|nr:hypothetical protein [bacterium]|tara:strand:- start:32820 stop:33356 length:537 start_codon:yes stop_codon:yes gene_type:complete